MVLYIVSNIDHIFISFYSLYIYNRLNPILEFPHQRIVQKEIMNRKKIESSMIYDPSIPSLQLILTICTFNQVIPGLL